MKRKQISAWWFLLFGGGAVRIFLDGFGFGSRFFFIGGRRIDEKSKEEFLISLRVELERVILGIRRIFVPRDVLI